MLQESLMNYYGIYNALQLISATDVSNFLHILMLLRFERSFTGLSIIYHIGLPISSLGINFLYPSLSLKAGEKTTLID